MSVPTSRQELKDYCLRKLGSPVININVANEQVEDRVDEALQTYAEKHYDATEKKWVAYEITQTDIDNGYITLPDTYLIVSDVLNASGISDENIAAWRQTNTNYNLSTYSPMDMVNYFITITNLEEVSFITNADERFDYTKNLNKLFIYADNDYVVGDKIAIHVYEIISSGTRLWNDKWLKAYSTVLIKEQWGSNMKKHGNIELLGGVTVNGKELYEEALEEKQALEEQLEEIYQEPVDFIFG